MKLKVLGSGSSGNCYLLENQDDCLMLEAGIDFKHVSQAINYDIGKISGCLITHEHGDHSKYAKNIMSASVDIYASAGTIDALALSGHRLHKIKAIQRFSVGGFQILPFTVQHDCAEPFGFLIRHEDMGTLLFATDTFYLPNTYKNLNHILIECNYDRDILDENVSQGIVPGVIRERTMESHMEFETCKDFLRANDLKDVINIVLIHVSGRNGDRLRFVDEITGLTGKRVCVACEGLEVDVNRIPF